MPKLSFAQEMYEMEHVVAAARSNAGILPDPDLALTLTDRLAAIIAETKELKTRQQALLAAQKVKTEEMAVLVQRGTWVARRLRAYIVLVLGTKHAQLTQFGIRLRRRPRRKARPLPAAGAGRLTEIAEPLAAVAEPLPDIAKPPAPVVKPSAAVRDDRPEARRSWALVRHDGATVPEVGGTVLRLGGEDFGIRADVAGLGAAVPPERGAVPPPGGTVTGDRAIVPEDRADAKRRRAIVPETRGAAARAA